MTRKLTLIVIFIGLAVAALNQNAPSGGYRESQITNTQ
jgi:hypothetical protein